MKKEIKLIVKRKLKKKNILNNKKIKIKLI